MAKSKKKHRVFSVKSGNKPLNYQVPEDPKINRDELNLNYEKWIPFGTNNLFPQSISSINRKSPVHRGILNAKTRYFSGHSLKTDSPQIEKWIKNVGANMSLHSLHKKFEFDYRSYGNTYIEIVTDFKSFISLFYRDAETGRVSKDNKNIIFHPDWVNVNKYKDKFDSLPIFPQFKKIGEFYRSCYHVSKYENGFYYYGIPSWFSGLGIAAIGYKTDKWNLSRLDNNMSLSGVLTVEADVDNDEQAGELKKMILDEYRGEGKNGGLIVIIKEPGGETETNFSPLQQSDDGEWLSLKTQVKDDLIIAHEWRRTLSGISDNTGFETDRILNDYSEVFGTQIQPSQQSWVDIYEQIIMATVNWEFDLSFENKKPVNPKRSNFTQKQTEAVLTVRSQYLNNDLSEEAAMTTLMVGYNMSKTEAENILK